ncbi:MAG: biotin/lipoyl-containing protein, partial [Gemmobacter sp.]
MATEILMPALSPTMEEGTLAKWLVAPGATVKSGQIIAEIETDKATMEFEAVDEGVIARILVPEGTQGVKVNTPIAILTDAGEAVPEAPRAEAAAKAAPAGGPAKAAPPAAAPVAAPAAPAPAQGGARIAASPLARRLAAERGIALADIAGSGPGGGLVRADVEGAPAPAPAA